MLSQNKRQVEGFPGALLSSGRLARRTLRKACTGGAAPGEKKKKRRREEKKRKKKEEKKKKRRKEEKKNKKDTRVQLFLDDADCLEAVFVAMPSMVTAFAGSMTRIVNAESNLIPTLSADMEVTASIASVCCPLGKKPARKCVGLFKICRPGFKICKTPIPV